MTGHDLTVIPIPAEHLAEGVTVWRCVRCDHTVTVRVAVGRAVWYRVAVEGDPAADHTGARWLAVEQAAYGMPRLPSFADAGGDG